MGAVVLQLQPFQAGSEKKTQRGRSSQWLYGKKWRGKEAALPREALRAPVLLLNCRGGKRLPIFQYACIIFPPNASLDTSECNNNESNPIIQTRHLKKIIYKNHATLHEWKGLEKEMQQEKSVEEMGVARNNCTELSAPLCAVPETLE